MPIEVQQLHYYRQDATQEARILRQEANCAMQSGKGARRASKQCEHVPPRCKPCCIQLGGCKEHPLPKVSLIVFYTETLKIQSFLQQNIVQGIALPTNVVPSQISVAPSHPVTTVPATQPAAASQPRTTFARNLASGYADGWKEAQRQKEARSIQLQLTQEAIENAQNTVSVVIWKDVRFILQTL